MNIEQMGSGQKMEDNAAVFFIQLKKQNKRLKIEDSACKNLDEKYLNVTITKEHQKIAFKGIIELDRDVKKNNKNFLRVDELWEVKFFCANKIVGE